MKINNFAVLNGFSALLSIAAAAAAFAFSGISASIATAVIVMLISFVSLNMAWSGETDKYKNLSDQVAIVGIILFLPIILYKGIFVALLILLLFAQLALNLVLKEYRQFYFGIATSFVGLCIGAAEAKQGIYLVYFLLYIICATQCLGLMHIDRELQLAGVGEWPKNIPARRLHLIAYISLLAVVLYLLLPRLPAANIGTSFYNNQHFYQNKEWEVESEQKTNNPNSSSKDREDNSSDTNNNNSFLNSESSEEHADINDTPENESGEQEDYSYDGLSNAFDIRNPDSQGGRFSNQLVARMLADKGLYLRAKIFDVFDGLKWSKSNEYLQKVALKRGKAELHKTMPTDRLIQQQIHIEVDIGDFIPASAVPQTIQFPGTVIGQDAFNQLRAPSNIRAGTVYFIKSKEYWYKGRVFAEQDYTSNANYLQLPDDFDPRIKALALDVANNTKTEFATAIKLEEHLRTEYEYSFESIFNSQNNTPLSKFLFEQKSGHCEYFASALTIMLRSLGVPARLVTGFSATQKNPLTGYYEIYAMNGHAWVEAFVDDIGWMVLEPTAFYTLPPEQEKDFLSAEKIDAYVEHISQMEDVLPKDKQKIGVLSLVKLWQALAFLATIFFAYIKLWILSTWPVFLGVGIGFVVVYFLWRRYRYRIRNYLLYKRVNVYRGNDIEKSIDFYLQAINTLMLGYQLDRLPGMTLEAYVTKLETLLNISLANTETIQNINFLKYAISQKEKANIEKTPNDLRALFNTLYEYILTNELTYLR